MPATIPFLTGKLTLAKWLRPAGRGAEAAFALPRGGVRRLLFATRGSVACTRGCVWITRDGGGEDIVLHAGETRWFPRDTGVLIEALEASEVRLPAAR